MGFDPRLQRATSQRDSVLRPTSPAAAFMQQPQRATSPVPVEQVMHHYGQAFPAERRSAQSEQARATSPLGVTLDARGGVAQDAYRGAAAQPMPAPARRVPNANTFPSNFVVLLM